MNRFHRLYQSGKISEATVIYPYTYQNPYYVLPPIGAEYAQASLESCEIKTRLFDMRFEENLESLKESIAGSGLVCLFGHVEYSPLYGHFDKNVIQEIFDIIPQGMPVIAGGKGFFNHEAPLEKFKQIDLVTMGQPDAAIKSILSEKSMKSICNIMYRTKEGGIVKNKREYTDLPESIYPRRDLRDQKYFYHAAGTPLDMLWSGYGCNHRCTFCSEFGKDYDRTPMRYRGRNAQSIFEEIKTIDAPIVAFYDDNMTTNMDVFLELADLLIENKVRKVIATSGRVNHVVKAGVEGIRKLEKAGVFALSLGMESVKDETLKLYRKGQNYQMLEKCMEIMNRTNIVVNGTFLLGSPGESEQDMMDILSFAKKVKLDNIGTNRLSVAKNTVLYQLLEKSKEKLPMITGSELADIKYKIKFGQRNPLRILRTLLKIYKNRGVKFEPTLILLNFINIAISHTWLEKTLALPLVVKMFSRLLKVLPLRPLTRTVAYLTMPLIDALLFAGSYLSRLAPNTNFLPSLFLHLKEGLFEKHRSFAQKLR